MTTLEVVRTDEFDRDDMEQMLDTSPRLRSAADTVTDATATGEGLVADLWSSLIRVAPRKVSIVTKMIKGKGLDEAYAILQYTPKAASPVLIKLFNCVPV